MRIMKWGLRIMLRWYLPKVLLVIDHINTKSYQNKSGREKVLPQLTMNLHFLKTCLRRPKLACEAIHQAIKRNGDMVPALYLFSWNHNPMLLKKQHCPIFKPKQILWILPGKMPVEKWVNSYKIQNWSLVSDIFMKIRGWVKVLKNSFLPLDKIHPGKIKFKWRPTFPLIPLSALPNLLAQLLSITCEGKSSVFLILATEPCVPLLTLPRIGRQAFSWEAPTDRACLSSFRTHSLGMLPSHLMLFNLITKRPTVKTFSGCTLLEPFTMDTVRDD